METSEDRSTVWRKFILFLNCILLGIGNCGGALISRLYFLRGGTRIWFSSWLVTAAWPITLIPLTAAYILRRRRRQTPTAKPFFITPKIFTSSAAIGVLTGLDDYLYAYGVAKLPISTEALIIATHLGFTAGFAFLLVKQKFTAYSVNAIVLLTMGAGVLAFGASSDRPNGESNKEYILGFVLTLLAALLYGFVLPWIELVYKQAKQAITYTLVLEIQLVMCFFSTAFCTVGMIINKDFQIPRRCISSHAAVCVSHSLPFCHCHSHPPNTHDRHSIEEEEESSSDVSLYFSVCFFLKSRCGLLKLEKNNLGLINCYCLWINRIYTVGGIRI